MILAMSPELTFGSSNAGSAAEFCGRGDVQQVWRGVVDE